MITLVMSLITCATAGVSGAKWRRSHLRATLLSLTTERIRGTESSNESAVTAPSVSKPDNWDIRALARSPVSPATRFTCKESQLLLLPSKVTSVDPVVLASASLAALYWSQASGSHIRLVVEERDNLIKYQVNKKISQYYF